MALKNRRTQKNKTNRRKQQSKRGGKKIGGNTRKNLKKKRQSRRMRMRGGLYDQNLGPNINEPLPLLREEVEMIANKMYNLGFCNQPHDIQDAALPVPHQFTERSRSRVIGELTDKCGKNPNPPRGPPPKMTFTRRWSMEH